MTLFAFTDCPSSLTQNSSADTFLGLYDADKGPGAWGEAILRLMAGIVLKSSP